MRNQFGDYFYCNPAYEAELKRVHLDSVESVLAHRGDRVSAWSRILHHDSPKVYRHYTNNRYGISVRCVKD